MLGEKQSRECLNLSGKLDQCGHKKGTAVVRKKEKDIDKPGKIQAEFRIFKPLRVKPQGIGYKQGDSVTVNKTTLWFQFKSFGEPLTVSLSLTAC